MLIKPFPVAGSNISYYSNGTNQGPNLKPFIKSNGVKLWVLKEDWKIWLDADQTWFFIVPTGTKTNFGTVPWFLRWAISPLDPVIAMPSVIHDYLVGEFMTPEQFYNHNPLAICIKDGETIAAPLLTKGKEWKDAAELFRLYALCFSGKTAYVKANVSWIFIRLRGLLK